MWNAINNALNDHQFMDTMINTIFGVGSLFAFYAFYLALTYERRFSPVRRKR